MARRERRTGDDIYNVIIEKGALGWKPAELQKHLQSFPEFSGRIPHRRTITRILEEDLPEPGDPWSFAVFVESGSDPRDARLALDVLAWVIEESEGRVQYLTIDQAKWVIRLRSAYPYMPVNEVWRLTLWYTRDDLSPDERALLDLWVAFRGWESEAANQRFYAAVGTPVNSSIPMLVLETDSEIPKGQSWGRFVVEKKRKESDNG